MNKTQTISKLVKSHLYIEKRKEKEWHLIRFFLVAIFLIASNLICEGTDIKLKSIQTPNNKNPNLASSCTLTEYYKYSPYDEGDCNGVTYPSCYSIYQIYTKQSVSITKDPNYNVKGTSGYQKWISFPTPQRVYGNETYTLQIKGDNMIYEYSSLSISVTIGGGTPIPYTLCQAFNDVEIVGGITCTLKGNWTYNHLDITPSMTANTTVIFDAFKGNGFNVLPMSRVSFGANGRVTHYITKITSRNNSYFNEDITVGNDAFASGIAAEFTPGSVFNIASKKKIAINYGDELYLNNTLIQSTSSSLIGFMKGVEISGSTGHGDFPYQPPRGDVRNNTYASNSYWNSHKGDWVDYNCFQQGALYMNHSQIKNATDGITATGGGIIIAENNSIFKNCPIIFEMWIPHIAGWDPVPTPFRGKAISYFYLCHFDNSPVLLNQIDFDYLRYGTFTGCTFENILKPIFAETWKNHAITSYQCKVTINGRNHFMSSVYKGIYI